jgi:hypothetical protein
MSNKIYCGSAKIVPTQYGELTKVSFHKEDINKMVSYLKSEGSDWINLVIKEKKEKVAGKPTHYLEVDTWKPTQQSEATPPTATAQADVSNTGDVLPF